MINPIDSDIGLWISLNMNWRYYSLVQLCPTRGPVEGFVRPSLSFGCSERILHTDNQSLFW